MCGEPRGMPGALCPYSLHYSPETGSLTEPGASLVVSKPQQSLDPPHTVLELGFVFFLYGCWSLEVRSPRMSNKCSSLLNPHPQHPYKRKKLGLGEDLVSKGLGSQS